MSRSPDEAAVDVSRPWILQRSSLHGHLELRVDGAVVAFVADGDGGNGEPSSHTRAIARLIARTPEHVRELIETGTWLGELALDLAALSVAPEAAAARARMVGRLGKRGLLLLELAGVAGKGGGS